MTIAMQVLEQSVVVFSQNYLPLRQVNIKQVIAGGWKIHAAKLILDVPKPIRLKIAATGRKRKDSPINRREMLRPDDNSWQHGDSNQHLTLEQIILRSPGSDHRSNNVVIAFKRCNSRNRNRTKKQAGMQLRTKPKPPVPQAIFVHEKFWINLQANLE